MASGSTSCPTDDPLLSSVKLKRRTKPKDDSATDSASKEKKRDDSGDHIVNVQQGSSAQLEESEKDLEDRGYHELQSIKGTGEGGTGADDNLSSSSETQSALEPPQDAGPGTSTSDAPRPLAQEENGREENIIKHELVDCIKQFKETMKIELVDLINQRIDMLLNSMTTRQLPSPALRMRHCKVQGGAIDMGKEPSTSTTAKETDNGLCYVVIDGSNVAMSHGNDKEFSCLGIKLCVDYFVKRGHQVKALVPLTKSYRSQNGRYPQVCDQHILDELKDEGHLVFTPARRLGNKHIVNHDDPFILDLAKLEDAVIVSKDNFREFLDEYREIITNRMLSYVFADDHFMLPRDPLGRYGPTLEQFLSKRPIQPAGQGCVQSPHQQQQWPPHQQQQQLPQQQQPPHQQQQQQQQPPHEQHRQQQQQPQQQHFTLYAS